jgi:hypothetical protein
VTRPRFPSLLCTLALLAGLLAVGRASASGINLSWNDCGTYGVGGKSSPCTVNNVVGSFVPPPGINALVAMEATLDVQTSSPVLPNWWQLNKTNGCRTSSLTSQFSFETLSSCSDYWQGQALGIMDFRQSDRGANRGMLRLVCAIGENDGRSVDSGTEYYAFQVVINNARSSGGDACSGCMTPACIILNSIELDEFGSSQAQILTNPVNRSMVTWQGGECQGGVRNRTFGQIKSIYRN